VHLVDTHGEGITQISEQGPVFDGIDYCVDLLVYATGFEFFKTGPRNRIIGQNGLDINEKYRAGIRTLLGIHTHGFPNFFIMGGLQASFQFNMSYALQIQGEHIADCISLAIERGARSMDVTEETEDWWVSEVLACRGLVLNNPDCTPGYYNAYGRSRWPQDRTYDGGFPRYMEYMTMVRGDPEKYFHLT
jgi:hypothetical protein